MLTWSVVNCGKKAPYFPTKMRIISMEHHADWPKTLNSAHATLAHFSPMGTRKTSPETPESRRSVPATRPLSPSRSADIYPSVNIGQQPSKISNNSVPRPLSAVSCFTGHHGPPRRNDSSSYIAIHERKGEKNLRCFV